MSALCIIPARGGSQRIPGKNIREFLGKPIIAYSIECAQSSGLFERVAVSTEDPDIAGLAHALGVSVYQRPIELARDEVGTQEVMAFHARQEAGLGVLFDFMCCLYPCAPLLEPQTLQRAAMLLTSGRAYVVPVATWLRDPGQFYLGWSWAFQTDTPLLASTTTILPIDPETECDINTEEDWLRAEDLYRARRARTVPLS